MNLRFYYRSWNSHSTLSSEKYPISRVCPKCGSGGYRLLGQSITVPFGRDRECVNCSTRYAPRQSKPAGIAFILLGLFLVIPFGLSTTASAPSAIPNAPHRNAGILPAEAAQSPNFAFSTKRV